MTKTAEQKEKEDENYNAYISAINKAKKNLACLYIKHEYKLPADVCSIVYQTSAENMYADSVSLLLSNIEKFAPLAVRILKRNKKK